VSQWNSFSADVVNAQNADVFKRRLDNSTQQDITDVGADTSYVRIYMSNLIKTFWLYNFFSDRFPVLVKSAVKSTTSLSLSSESILCQLVTNYDLDAQANMAFVQ